jgi:hypothetical protein
MAQWTPEELLCNSRGLDDGYLYVHKSHPLSRKLAAVLEGGKTAKSPKVRLTDSAAYGTPGFSGSLRPPLGNEIFPLDEDTAIPPPPTAGRIDPSRRGDSAFGSSILANAAVCVAFSEPPKLSHKSVLLPGARVPSPVLTADDKRIRRPRLNRGGGTIANLGMAGNGRSHQSGYGSMNISSYERDLAERTGRGGQMNQAGTRAWGAMEPAPKRVRAAMDVNLPNPFTPQYPPPRPQYPQAAPQYQHALARQPPAPYQHQPERQQQPGYPRPPHGSQQQSQQHRQPYAPQQFQHHHAAQHLGAQQQQQWPNAGGYHPQNAMQQGPGYSQYQHRSGGGGAGPYPPQQQYPQQQHQQQFQQATYRPPQPYNPADRSRPGAQPLPQSRHAAGGYNFRSHNAGSSLPPHAPPPHQRQAPAPASADVMRNLKAQLSSTLNQSRQKK